MSYFDNFGTTILAKAGSLILWDSEHFIKVLEPRKTREKPNFRSTFMYVWHLKLRMKNILKKQKHLINEINKSLAS